MRKLACTALTPGVSRMKRYNIVALLLCCLLFLSACSQNAQTPSQDPPQAAQQPETPPPNIADPAKTSASYEAEGWTPISSTVCQHGDPFNFTDVTYQKTAADGTTETVCFCHYRQREYTPQ